MGARNVLVALASIHSMEMPPPPPRHSSVEAGRGWQEGHLETRLLLPSAVHWEQGAAAQKQEMARLREILVA